MGNKRLPVTAFSLVELMVAITFICIGFFGYVALHARLLHSGQRLEEREKTRAITDFMEAVNFTRATMDISNALNLTAFEVDPQVSRVLWVTTDMRGGDSRWKEFYAPEQVRDLDRVMVRKSATYRQPFTYKWGAR
jgi:Tfp pilus assembly protein PilV